MECPFCFKAMRVALNSKSYKDVNHDVLPWLRSLAQDHTCNDSAHDNRNWRDKLAHFCCYKYTPFLFQSWWEHLPKEKYRGRP